jgi:hypothetical protein
MNPGRWEETIAHTAATHGLSTFPGERMYRPALIAGPSDRLRVSDGAGRRHSSPGTVGTGFRQPGRRAGERVDLVEGERLTVHESQGDTIERGT